MTDSHPILNGTINNENDLKDELKREPFAKGIAKLITTSPENECLVIGIEGAWGEGKSYTVELIRRDIEEYNQSNDLQIRWMVFNPWHFKDCEHLAGLFLRELALTVEQELGVKRPP